MPEDDQLAGMDPEGLRRTLGELLAANRKTQANLDEIRQQFPIQPEHLADSIPDWSELEEGGLEPPEEGGSFEEQLGIAPGFIKVEKLKIAKGAGTVKSLLCPVPFQAAHVGIIAVADGHFNGASPISNATLGGRGLGSTIGLWGANNFPAITQLSLPAGTEITPFGRGPGPIKLTVERSAEMNAKTRTLLFVVFIEAGGMVNPSAAGGEVPTEDKGVLKNPAGEKIGLFNDFELTLYGRETNSLPTARSDTSLVEVQAEYAEGKMGTAGAQIYFPSLGEREAGTAHTFTWTFPNVVPNENKSRQCDRRAAVLA